MPTYMKAALVLSVVALAAAPVWAQPYYARGNFTGVPATDWGTTNPLTETPVGSGHYQGTVTGLTAGNYYEFKLANASWSENWPAGNARFLADASGEATFHLYKAHPVDGWSPAGVRVGYKDVGMTWEVMGSFNGWGAPVVALDSLGGGQYSATYTVVTPGSYQFKFRKTADWGVSIGTDFGNSAGNITIGTSAANQVVRFDLDLLNGRYRVTLVGASTVFDGTLTSAEWANPKASAVQDNYTGFGDQHTGPVLSGGSELDGLFVKAKGDRLYVGITGNLEKNNNAVLLFFDTKGGGQNQFAGVFVPNDLPTAFPNMQNDILDTGFAPDYVLAINADGSNGGTAYVDWYELQDGTGATHISRGQVALNSGGSTLTGGTNPASPNDLQLAFDDTNVSGVTTTSAADAALATTGIEASIPLSHLGIASLPATIRVQALLVGKVGWVSNQSLPTMPAGTAELGNGTFWDGVDHSADVPPPTPVDFNNVTGLQHAEFSLTDRATAPTVDGRDIPADFADRDLAALQENTTSFGDQTWVTGVIPGNEIDQMLVKTDDLGNILFGITGNIAADGTNLVIFLDAKAGGETVLADHGGRLAGNAGDTLPCPMDYAILLNRGGGNIYVDFYDLQANTMLYMGSIPENALLGGPLTGGDPSGASWMVGANMTNLLGVNDNAAADPQTANALTATTGFELLIPRSQIGLPADIFGSSTIHLLAVVTGQNGSISNQILPAGLGGGIPPFATDPTDFTNVNGKSYHCLDATIGVCNIPRFDADGDKDVDQEDFGIFQRCYTGTTPGLVTTACACFDWDLAASDGFIDQADYGAFQRCLIGGGGIHGSGPTIPADPNCDKP